MQKTFKVSISNGRNRTLSTSSSVSFETDLFISEPEIPYLNSSRRVLVLLMFELFLYSRPSHCFLSLHLLEDCKVALFRACLKHEMAKWRNGEMTK